MKVKFYLELATRVQDERLQNLLRLPADAGMGEGEWIARWWRHGKTKRMRSTDREKIIRRIVEGGLNELNLKWHSEDHSANNAPIHLVNLEAFFSPSWTSALWAPVPTEKLAFREDERNRKSFGGGKLPDYKEFQRPQLSTLECFLEFECEENNVKDGEFQSRIIDWLKPAIQEGCKSLNYFGYGCVHGTCRKMSMKTSMGGVGAWTDELGERFENIYPILIGPVASCEGLAVALGGRCSLIRISEQTPTAIVSIPPEHVEEIRESPAVKEWVVIRDISKLNAPAATLDEIYRKERSISWIAPFVKR